MLLYVLFFFFCMIRRPPRSTLFPTRRSSDLAWSGYDPVGAYIQAQVAKMPRDGYPGLGDQNWFAAYWQEFNQDRKSTRLNSSHRCISYAVFCLKKKKKSKKKKTTKQM